MNPCRAAITSLGCSVPEQVVTNLDLTRMGIPTSDEWIRNRTGIERRRFAPPGTPASALAVPAVRECLERRGLAPSELDLIIVATVTPDMSFPATACLIQDQIGASRAWGFDLSAACSGFLYALSVGAQFVQAGTHQRVLVVGVDVMTSIIDMQDRGTCVLFGDGAGAVLLEPARDGTGLIDFLHEVDGSGGRYLNMPAGGSARPASHQTVDQRMHFVRQEGSPVFKYAVRKMVEIPLRLLGRNRLTAAEVDLLVAHQANRRIIDAAAERLGIAGDRVILNIQDYGNTTAATIPLALATALDERRLSRGHLVLFAAVGAGFTVGTALLRWTGFDW